MKQQGVQHPVLDVDESQQQQLLSEVLSQIKIEPHPAHITHGVATSGAHHHRVLGAEEFAAVLDDTFTVVSGDPMMSMVTQDVAVTTTCVTMSEVDDMLL